MRSMLLLVVVFLAVAPVASACEACIRDVGVNWTCWSGEQSGYQWCYGGGLGFCQVGGSCPSFLGDPPSEGPAEVSAALVFGPVRDAEAAAERPAPAGGFALDVE